MINNGSNLNQLKIKVGSAESSFNKNISNFHHGKSNFYVYVVKLNDY